MKVSRIELQKKKVPFHLYIVLPSVVHEGFLASHSGMAAMMFFIQFILYAYMNGKKYLRFMTSIINNKRLKCLEQLNKAYKKLIQQTKKKRK